MNGVSSQCAKLKLYDNEDDKPIMIKKPLPLRTVSWSDNIEESDLDVPGTPRTPRTSTTKGIAIRNSWKSIELSRESHYGTFEHQRSSAFVANSDFWNAKLIDLTQSNWLILSASLPFINYGRRPFFNGRRYWCKTDNEISNSDVSS